jgi:hypothetical protein
LLARRIATAIIKAATNATSDKTIKNALIFLRPTGNMKGGGWREPESALSGSRRRPCGLWRDR